MYFNEVLQFVMTRYSRMNKGCLKCRFTYVVHGLQLQFSSLRWQVDIGILAMLHMCGDRAT